MAQNRRVRRWGGLPAGTWAAAALAALLACSGSTQSAPRGTGGAAQESGTPKLKPDPKAAKEEYKKGVAAEHEQDWRAAFEAYGNASILDPSNQQYAAHRELARSRAVQAEEDAAERDAVAGRLIQARKEMLQAHLMDPSDATLTERLRELTQTEPEPAEEAQPAVKEFEPAGEIHLEPQAGKRDFDYKGDTQGAYLEVAHTFGVDAVFDVDLISRPARLRIEGVDFQTAMTMLGDMTGTFWRPLTKHLLFVAADTPEKRKEYDVSVARTILLPASETPEQMTEMLRMVREIAGITHSELDTRSRTMTLRASPRAIAVASDLVENMEKAPGQLVLEIEVLQVDRTYAQNLGLAPPQAGHLYTLSQQQVQEALQSENGLISVIEQLFGTPSALSGLSPSQIAELLGAGQLGSFVPNVVKIGGGKTTFLATLPGASANFAELLSLVRHGRRILLRASDGQPATFFVGDHIPVSLAQFSASLGGAGVNVNGVSSTEFPSANYATGNAPTFITAADLIGSGVQDLVTANFTDNTVSVLLGNGDGTFQAKTDYATGGGPAWIATGDFNGDKDLDLAVANENSNTISILLGNGDGTFQNQTTIATGNQPVAVLAADMHDKSGTGNLDLIVANKKDNTIGIYQGNGDGTFQAPTLLTLPGGYAPSSLAVADFNADGHLDLAVTDQGNNSVSIFLGNGDGTFQNRVDYPVGNSPVWVSTADFNADGILDLAVANNGAPTDTLAGNSVSILLGQANPNNTSVGSGAFGTQTAYAAGTGPTSIAVADYNVDGIPDLAVTAQGDNAVAVLLGQGPGTFGPFFELTVGSDPVSIVSEDFNDDGRSDAAVANNGSNNATVILNTATFTPGNGLGGTPFPGAQYIDVGLKVKATPHLHRDDEVSLQLEYDISSITAQSFNDIPVISDDAVEQTVRLRENETSVLAGIFQPQVTTSLSGTPGIAAIPGIGGLEGNGSTQSEDSELLILLTPRMMLLSPRRDREIYAGQGAPEGFGGAVGLRELREGEIPVRVEPETGVPPNEGRPAPPRPGAPQQVPQNQPQQQPQQ
jgi:hypothetical protein